MGEKLARACTAEHVAAELKAERLAELQAAQRDAAAALRELKDQVWQREELQSKITSLGLDAAEAAAASITAHFARVDAERQGCGCWRLQRHTW